jgi:hypothetical protein
MAESKSNCILHDAQDDGMRNLGTVDVQFGYETAQLTAIYTYLTQS